MAMLNPKLSILDETDSGLDIDALKIVANGVNTLKNNENATIVITHYQRLLDYIVPDYVHILHDGRIVKSGDKNLALEMEEKGYEWITKEKSPVSLVKSLESYVAKNNLSPEKKKLFDSFYKSRFSYN